jgi:hypothetical protein
VTTRARRPVGSVDIGVALVLARDVRLPDCECGDYGDRRKDREQRGHYDRDRHFVQYGLIAKATGSFENGSENEHGPGDPDDDLLRFWHRFGCRLARIG